MTEHCTKLCGSLFFNIVLAYENLRVFLPSEWRSVSNNEPEPNQTNETGPASLAWPDWVQTCLKDIDLQPVVHSTDSWQNITVFFFFRPRSAAQGFLTLFSLYRSFTATVILNKWCGGGFCNHCDLSQTSCGGYLSANRDLPTLINILHHGDALRSEVLTKSAFIHLYLVGGLYLLLEKAVRLVIHGFVDCRLDDCNSLWNL